MWLFFGALAPIEQGVIMFLSVRGLGGFFVPVTAAGAKDAGGVNSQVGEGQDGVEKGKLVHLVKSLVILGLVLHIFDPVGPLWHPVQFARVLQKY
jgi:hypothetical protein